MKIVTLLPSATELVCLLGLRDALVAVSHECDYPNDLDGLPAITSSIIPHNLSPQQIDDAVVDAVKSGQALYQVDGELLEKLQPDLIITQGVCDVCAVNTETVEKTLMFMSDFVADDVQVLSLNGGSFAGVLRDIKRIGEVTGTADTAQQQIASFQRRWDALTDTQPTTKPSVLMLEWPEPFFYGGHWVPEMIEVAGGRDLFGQAGVDSGRCTLDDVITKDPDVIIVGACGYGLDKNVQFAETFVGKAEHQALKAVKNGAVWAIDANSYASRPTPRLIDGATKIQAIFKGRTNGVEGIVRVGV